MTRQNFISLVVAVDPKGGIGKDGKLAWNLKEDLKFFKQLTTSTASVKNDHFCFNTSSSSCSDTTNNTDQNKKDWNVVIMGRKTWDSIPDKFKPLPRRINIILSKSQQQQQQHQQYQNCVWYANSLEKALEMAKHRQNVFIIGGSSIYKQALDMKLCDFIFITRILNTIFDCDTFLPDIDDNGGYVACDIEEYLPWIKPVEREENGLIYQFSMFKRKC